MTRSSATAEGPRDMLC